jgi:hypothetical protein
MNRSVVSDFRQSLCKIRSWLLVQLGKKLAISSSPSINCHRNSYPEKGKYHNNFHFLGDYTWTPFHPNQDPQSTALNSRHRRPTCRQPRIRAHFTLPSPEKATLSCKL